MQTATAIAHPNIAFIKYWGNRDDALRLPLTGSLSMNLAGLQTRTSVSFEGGLETDQFVLNGAVQTGAGVERVSKFLDVVRGMAGFENKARVVSENNFPAGAGIASSASAFAALALATSSAAGLSLQEHELSRLARLGSGSACRSIPAGFVEWLAGEDDRSSYAVSIAPAEHWDLVDLICVVDEGHKEVGSTAGHALAHSSTLNPLRIAEVPQRLAACKDALLSRDFTRFAEAVESDSDWMHAVMRTSSPPLRYWTQTTELILWSVRAWRDAGLALCTTVDAGPNVHVLALASEAEWAKQELARIPGVLRVLEARPGGGAFLIPD